MMECFAAYVALCERKNITDRLESLDREQKTSWRDWEIDGLQRELLEVDGMITRHRATARRRGN